MKKASYLLAFFLLLSAPLLAESKIISASIPIKEKALVHVYRPSRVVGFGWVFNLKANDKKVARIKNGKSLVLDLDPGQTQFRIKKKKINLNLEAGKSYYLRASLVRNLLIGKPDLVEVTENFAQAELKYVVYFKVLHYRHPK